MYGYIDAGKNRLKEKVAAVQESETAQAIGKAKARGICQIHTGASRYNFSF